MNYRIERQAAYVLHTRPYRDTSALVDLFSLEYGKVSVVCRGVRRPNSKLRALVQPFVPLQVSWQGRNDLKTLSLVESVGFNGLLTGKALVCGLYANELLHKLLAVFDPHPKLFVYYQYLLTALSKNDIEVPLRIFEQQLLEEMGVLVDLANLQEGALYYYNPSELVFEHRATIDERLAGYFFQAEDLSAIYRVDYSQLATRRAAKRFMRLQIEVLLNGKPLHSRNLLKVNATSSAITINKDK